MGKPIKLNSTLGSVKIEMELLFRVRNQAVIYDELTGQSELYGATLL